MKSINYGMGYFITHQQNIWLLEWNSQLGKRTHSGGCSSIFVWPSRSLQGHTSDSLTDCTFWNEYTAPPEACTVYVSMWIYVRAFHYPHLFFITYDRGIRMPIMAMVNSPSFAYWFNLHKMTLSPSFEIHPITLFSQWPSRPYTWWCVHLDSALICMFCLWWHQCLRICVRSGFVFCVICMNLYNNWVACLIH